LVPFSGPGAERFDQTNVPEILELVRQALELEDKAMDQIKEAVEA
jgi:hypothetical protein